MVFAQFYRRAVPHKWNGYSDHIIPACSDRAVVILDGRNSAGAHHDIAADECVKRCFIGYTLHRGDSFTRNQQITDLIVLQSQESQHIKSM